MKIPTPAWWFSSWCLISFLFFSPLCVKLSNSFQILTVNNRLIWACVWPTNVNDICIYESTPALYFSMINLNVTFHPMSGSALPIVLVVIHLFLLRDENIRIWAEAELSGLLSSGWLCPHDGGMNTLGADYIKSVRLISDTFALMLQEISWASFFKLIFFVFVIKDKHDTRWFWSLL